MGNPEYKRDTVNVQRATLQADMLLGGRTTIPKRMWALTFSRLSDVNVNWFPESVPLEGDVVVLGAGVQK